MVVQSSTEDETRNSRDGKAHPALRNVLEQSGKSLHISRAATMVKDRISVPGDIDQIAFFFASKTHEHHSTALCHSTQMISVRLTISAQVLTENLLLKHSEINIPTFHVLKGVPSDYQK